MADALVPVDDDGLATNHREHIALGTDAGAGPAADAVVVVDVRMLRLGPFGKQFALFDRFVSAGLPLLQALQITHKKEEANEAADPVSDEGFHGLLLEVPKKKLQSDVQQRQHCKGVAERLMHDVPEVENFLRAREKQYSLGKRGFFRRRTNRFFEFAVAEWEGIQRRSGKIGRS